MVRKMVPPEILLNILSHLEGDSETILSLTLTCKLFRALLTENEPRIAFQTALNRKPGPVRFLLEATAPAIKPLSFHWLTNAYARGHAIELLVNALENAGIYKDQSVFGTIFSAQGRPLVPQDHTDVRRYVITMLVAIEFCSVSGKRSHKLVWATLGPRWTAGLVLCSRELVRFVVKTLYLVIENHDASTWGPSDAPSGFSPTNQQATMLTKYLLTGMLHSGVKGLVDILSTTYETYSQFVAVARQRLFNFHLKRHPEEELLPQQQLPRRLWFVGALMDRSVEERHHAPAPYDDYAWGTDIDDWKSEIVDDEAWTRFVHDNGWCKPLVFTPAQLRMKLPKPTFQSMFETNGAIVRNASDGKRIMAQPLAA